MSTSDPNYAPSKFIEFLKDEDDSGSELGELEEHTKEEEGEREEEFMDIENMLMIEMADDRSMHPLSPCSSPEALPDNSLSSRAAWPEPNEFAVFFEGSPALPETAAAAVTAPARDQPRTRGVNRTPGGIRGRGGGTRGRGADAATRAVGGDGGWRRGERVIEVCLTDEDVPPRLREMVHELDASRRKARNAQQASRQRNVRTDEDDDSEDEFFDAESSIVDELFGGDASAMEFQWSPVAAVEQEVFQPVNAPGPQQPTPCAYEAFRQYWDDEILNHIVTETNRYANDLKSTSSQFARQWYDTNIHEILTFFAFWIMLGIIRMPSIKSCFCLDPLLKTGIFRKLFYEQRYWALNRALHFVDNSTRRPDSSKLFCLGPLVDHLNKKFSEVYTPNQNITIDESLSLWRGNLSFKQYIKTKAARLGVKTFELCESTTGYLWSFTVYLGKDGATSSRVLPKSIEVVMKLVRPLLNQGYRLFMNNRFNSPVLARFLKRNGTDCVGTLRESRQQVPNLIKLATLPQGTCIARQSGEVVVMAYQDQKKIYTISTCHGTESVPITAKPGRPAQYRPAVIHNYNAFMGGVDKKDQMLEPYLIETKRCQKWYKQIFKRLLNVSILNSRVLVHKSTATNQANQLAFRLELVDKIIKRHLDYVPRPHREDTRDRIGSFPSTRFAGKHFIVRTEVEAGGSLTTGGPNRTSRGRRYCVWCTAREKRYKRTVWKCDNCDVPLCLEGCFKNFHSLD